MAILLLLALHWLVALQSQDLQPLDPSQSNWLKSRLESIIKSLKLAMKLFDDLYYLNLLCLIRIPQLNKPTFFLRLVHLQ